jgi:predicted Zn-dependent protease
MVVSTGGSEAGLAVGSEAESAVGAVRDVRVGVDVTVVQSTAAVWLVDSHGRAGSYTTTEAQLTLRSPRGALGAALAASVAELDVAAALADLDREDAIHRLPVAGSVPKPAWLLLTPLATAQLLSHLTGGLLRAHYRDSPVGERIGSDAVTLIDDGTLTGVPFDDEGVPTRRTTIVRKGQCEGLLSALPDSTGNARRQDWAAHTAAAPYNLFLEPQETAPEPDGTGLLVTRISGVREAALDLRHTPLRLTVHGATLCDGSLRERVQGVVETTGRRILSGIVAVGGPMRFFRVTGVHGGAMCLIEGLEVRL